MMDWIKVEHRLPKSGERILIYWTHRGKQVPDIIDYESDAFELLQSVTHWMPIVPPGSDEPAPDDMLEHESGRAKHAVAALADCVHKHRKMGEALTRVWELAERRASHIEIIEAAARGLGVNEKPAPADELTRARAALASCGISGIYDEFTDVADAVDQMASYIRELEDRADDGGWERPDDERRAVGEAIIRNTKQAIEELESRYDDGESWDTGDALLSSLLGYIQDCARRLQEKK